MKTEIYLKKEVDIRTVEVDIAVRYDEEDIPNDFPMRKGKIWSAKIDIETGQIHDWPKGKTGDMHMKICDEGSYRLIDDKGEMIAEIDNDYVPNRLLPPHDGYGDYIHLIIDENGVITNWYKDPSVEDFFPED